MVWSESLSPTLVEPFLPCWAIDLIEKVKQFDGKKRGKKEKNIQNVLFSFHFICWKKGETRSTPHNDAESALTRDFSHDENSRSVSSSTCGS